MLMYNPQTGQYFESDPNNGGQYQGMGAPYAPQPQYTPRTPPNPMVTQPSQMTNPQRVLSIMGRFIKDISEVKPGEIPMDGTTCFFPTEDYMTIFAKVWGQDGKLYTFEFVPKEQQAPEVVEDKWATLESRLNARFNSLEEKLFSEPKSTTVKKGKEEK